MYLQATNLIQKLDRSNVLDLRVKTTEKMNNLPQEVTSFICKCKGRCYYNGSVSNNFFLVRGPDNKTNEKAIKVLNTKKEMVGYIQKRKQKG